MPDLELGQILLGTPYEMETAPDFMTSSLYEISNILWPGDYPGHYENDTFEIHPAYAVMECDCGYDAKWERW